MNVQTKTWARPLALFIALTMVMMYSFGGVAFAQQDKYPVAYSHGGPQTKHYEANVEVTVGDLPNNFNDPDLYAWKLNGKDTDLGQLEGTIYSPGQTFTMPANAINFKLVTRSAPDETYTVTYAPGEYGSFTAVSHPNLELGEDTPLPPEETPGTGDYIFDRWDPTPTETVEGSITYTAIWKLSDPAKTYTVTYLPGTNGTFDATSTSGLALGAATPTSPAVTGQSNFTFTGWSPTWSATVTGDVTYIAQWEPNDPAKTYTVTYLPGTNGTFNATSTSGLALGAATPTSPAVTGQSNFTFTGWSPTWSATVTGDATYTAQWQEDNPAATYTVTYLPGTHGTFAATSTSGLLSGADTPTSPAVTGQTGYTFTGWSPTWSATVTGDATYTAIWSQNETTTGGGGGGGGGGGTTTITPAPVPTTNIPETETPLVEAPEATLEEQPIPLADVPQTGDNTNIWLLLALMMGSGAGIVLLGRRKETVEK